MQCAEEFLEPLLSRLEPGARVLDVGCGDGAQAAYIRERHPEILYTGIDIAEITERLGEIFSPDRFTFRRTSALDLPFADQEFDAVFSFGVLGYTGDARLGFQEMTRVLRKGGRSGLWLFERQSNSAQMMHRVLSRALRALPGPLARLACYLLAPVLWFVPNKSGIHPGNSSWKQCAEIMAVNLLYLVDFFEREELEAWHEEEGFSQVECVEGSPLTFYALKN